MRRCRNSQAASEFSAAAAAANGEGGLGLNHRQETPFQRLRHPPGRRRLLRRERRKADPGSRCVCAQCLGVTSSMALKPALNRLLASERSHSPDRCRPGEAAAELLSSSPVMLPPATCHCPRNAPCKQPQTCFACITQARWGSLTPWPSPCHCCPSQGS